MPTTTRDPAVDGRDVSFPDGRGRRVHAGGSITSTIGCRVDIGDGVSLEIGAAP